MMSDYKLFNGLIVFALWGDNPLYVKGMIENIKLAQQHYPGWTVRVYVDRPRGLTAYGSHVQEIVRGLSNGSAGMFWRYEAAADPNYHYIIFRDADSRINPREVAAVVEWIESGKTLHLMRDHPHHKNWHVMGGMWGIKGGVLPGIVKDINKWLTPRMRSEHERQVKAINEHYDRRAKRLADVDKKIGRLAIWSWTHGRLDRIKARQHRRWKRPKRKPNVEVPKLADQYYLRDRIYPLFGTQYGTPSTTENGTPCQKYDVVQHDSQNRGGDGFRPFPEHEPYRGHVGQIVEAA